MDVRIHPYYIYLTYTTILSARSSDSLVFYCIDSKAIFFKAGCAGTSKGSIKLVFSHGLFFCLTWFYIQIPEIIWGLRLGRFDAGILGFFIIFLSMSSICTVHVLFGVEVSVCCLLALSTGVYKRRSMLPWLWPLFMELSSLIWIFSDGGESSAFNLPCLINWGWEGEEEERISGSQLIH